MRESFGLDKLCVGDSAIVCGSDHRGGVRRRLFDMGFTEGACVRCVGVSPCGDMKAYSVKESVVAVRIKDAVLIKVRRAEGFSDAEH